MESLQNFNRREQRDPQESLGVNVRKVLKRLKEIGANNRNWFDSTRDRDFCRALVTESLNLRVL
jgi:hypothetical protein